MAVNPELSRVLQIMDELRAPGGCPWVAVQTHESLAHYAIEEGYEVAEAAESADPDQLKAELGDLLLQVIFHARIASEAEGGFTIEDVAHTLAEKLIRRHPHVYGDTGPLTLAELEEQWERIKREETAKASPDSAPKQAPESLPTLMQAQKYLRGAASGDTRSPEDSWTSRLLDLLAEANGAGIDADTQLRRFLKSAAFPNPPAQTPPTAAPPVQRAENT